MLLKAKKVIRSLHFHHFKNNLMQNIIIKDLVNEDFSRSIKRLRSILPVLSFTLLISTYLISAVIMGHFSCSKCREYWIYNRCIPDTTCHTSGEGNASILLSIKPCPHSGQIFIWFNCSNHLANTVFN